MYETENQNFYFKVVSAKGKLTVAYYFSVNVDVNYIDRFFKILVPTDALVRKYGTLLETIFRPRRWAKSHIFKNVE
jgi:hypothetical protein